MTIGSEAQTEPRVRVSIEQGVADVRLTRADKMNALDPAMISAIAESIDKLGRAEGLRAVVLSGEGRGFCAGLDMASMAAGGLQDLNITDRTHGPANLFQQTAWGWRMLGVPVIAAVHGVAFGGGFQIMCGADIRIAHAETRMAIMEMKWGLVPDMAGIALWRTLVRDDVLRELTYTNREFSGQEAQALGFVTRIADDPHAEAMALARTIANRNPDAIQGVKRLYNAAVDHDAATLLRMESEEQARVLGSPNQMEAVLANMQKRTPVFGD